MAGDLCMAPAVKQGRVGVGLQKPDSHHDTAADKQ